MPNPNQPLVNASILVHRFALALGWRGIERTEFTLKAGINDRVLAGTVVTCWSTNDHRFFIQINQTTPGQFGEYNVSVVAERYNIGPMGFSVCRFETADEADSEAQRLSRLFAKTNFRDKRWRRRFLEQHPTKLLHPKKKWRGWKRRLRSAPL